MSGMYTEVSKLVGTGAIGLAHQGWTVKLSEDGNFLFIVGYADNVGDVGEYTEQNSIGAVWFYQKINGVWTQKQKIVPTGYSGHPQLGWSLAVNPSMNTLIVGAVYDNNYVGASFMFSFNGTSWTQQGPKLVGSDYSGEPLQGRCVALSADGNTAISGGPHDANWLGAAWIFVRTENSWSQQGSKLVGSDATSEAQQYAVALTSDGNLAVLGGFADNSGKGAIWVFLRTNSAWSQVGTKITATDENEQGWFGYSLALSGDNQTLIVGGYKDNSDAGATWILKRNGNTFTQFGTKLVATGSFWFGHSVAVNKQGTIVAVGEGTYYLTQAGAVWMYYFNGTHYNMLGNKIVAADAIGDAVQGATVSLDASGSQLLFGGYQDNGGTGATWIFENPVITNSPSFAPTAPTTQPSIGPTTQPSMSPVQASSSSNQMFLGLSLVTGIILLVLLSLCVCVILGFCIGWRKLKSFQKRTDAMEITTWITHSGNKADINLSHSESFENNNPMRVPTARNDTSVVENCAEEY